MTLTEELREFLVNELKKCQKYTRIGEKEIRAEIEKFRSDPVFGKFGLYSEDYVKAKARGGLIVSIHRKLGDFYENAVRKIFSATFGIPVEELKYTATIEISGKGQERSIDCRLMLDKVADTTKRKEISKIIKRLGSEKHGARDWDGIGFEIRFCYQIGDSKRIQADITMSEKLKNMKVLPVMLIFSDCSLQDPITRFRNRSDWVVIEGRQGYDLVKEIAGFDLFEFLSENKKAIDAVLEPVRKLL